MKQVALVALGIITLTAATFQILVLLAGAPVASTALTTASAVVWLVVGCWAWRAAWAIGRRRSV